MTVDTGVVFQVLEWVGKTGCPTFIFAGVMFWAYKYTPELFKYLRERDALRAKTEAAWNETAGKMAAVLDRTAAVLDRNTTVTDKTVAVIERYAERRP